MEILYLLVPIVIIISLWAIFIKANEKGWYTLIPVYNLIVLLRIIEKPWWWIFLLFFPVLNSIFFIWMLNLLRKKFNLEIGFLFGLIFLSFIFFPILAFGDAKYQGKSEISKSDNSHIAIINGVLLGIILIFVSVVFYVTGNMFSKSGQYGSYIVIVLGVILSQISYRKAIGGTMIYGEALAIGVLTVIFASIISSVYTFLLFEVIDPSLQEQMRLFTEEQIIKQGKVPEEQMEMALNMATKFQTPIMMLVMGIFGGTFIGLIISLITSIFTQKKPAEDVVE